MPFSAVHSCICGYSFGRSRQKSRRSQLIEQTARIHIGIFFCFVIQKQGGTASIAVAVGGLVLGEMVSAPLHTAYIFPPFFSRPEKERYTLHASPLSGLFCGLKELLPLSLPLTANRVLLNLLQSIEAISIPGKLRQYHLSTSGSFEPLRSFKRNGASLYFYFHPPLPIPSSVMLMPTIAEIQTSKTKKEARRPDQKSHRRLFYSRSLVPVFLLTGCHRHDAFQQPDSRKVHRNFSMDVPVLYTNSACSA